MLPDSKECTRDYSYEELSRYFHMPINDVSSELGICATLLKKICRKHGIKRWPHRKIKSLDNMIEAFERLAEMSGPEDLNTITNDIRELKKKRDFLLKNPNVSYNSVLPKHCVNAFNARIQKNGLQPSDAGRKMGNFPMKANKTIHKSRCSPRRSARNFGREHNFHSSKLADSSEDESDEGYLSEDLEEDTVHNVPLRLSTGTMVTDESAALWLLELHEKHPFASHLPAKLRMKFSQPCVSPGLASLSNLLASQH